jgi:hypothetical protein
MSDKNKDAERQAKETIEKIKDYGSWIILIALFIIVGWPLIIEFTR